jgi:DNA-binding NarL/FixJ family response regulator
VEKRRVVYVDDDAMVARLVKRIFEARYPAYEILVVGSASEATDQVHHLASEKAMPRALVTDVRLGGGMDGPELIGQLRTQFPHLRMIVVSSVRDPKDVQRARNAGANAFVEKGISVPTFVGELIELIQCPTDLIERIANG